MLFDTHSHIFLEPLDQSVSDIIMRMKEYDIRYAVQIWCTRKSNDAALALAKKYPHLPATIGFHPTDGQGLTDAEITEEIDHMENLLTANRQYIVWIGETGLDYFHLENDQQKETQKTLFREHVKLARKYSLPLVIHCRSAKDDMLELIRETEIQKYVMHCYGEDYEFAKKLMEISSDVYFSFSGILTYKNAAITQDAAYSLPLDRILIETDAPYLAPQAVRGTVNEPANVRYIFEKLAEIRPESKEVIEKMIYANSIRFYSLDYESAQN